MDHDNVTRIRPGIGSGELTEDKSPELPPREILSERLHAAIELVLQAMSMIEIVAHSCPHDVDVGELDQRTALKGCAGLLDRAGWMLADDGALRFDLP